MLTLKTYLRLFFILKYSNTKNLIYSNNKKNFIQTAYIGVGYDKINIFRILI
jgi:hypothetical protein